MVSDETIVALSSSAGVAARAIVRLSGAQAQQIASKIAELPDTPGRSKCGLFHIGSWEVPGAVYFFRSPRSYTGEDLVEFHLPGNALVCQRLIAVCVKHGARLAEPGEFTARAFFNGKMDLTQAEGVAATISALNERQLSAARQLMAGELVRRLEPITEWIAETLALLEAGIDFVDEEINFISAKDLTVRLQRADEMLRDLVEQSARFGPLGAEPTVVLVGRPNAGKSTLLNALAQCERAIVSPVPGTTRDALSADVVLPHGIVKMIDVAGIDTTAAANEIDRQMQSQARRAAELADVIIHVIEALDEKPPIDLPRPADIRLRSKIDLGGEIAPCEIAVSAVTGQGMDQLRQRLDQLAFGSAQGGATLSLNARHLQAISDVRSAIARAQADADKGHEYAALHLRESLDHLGQITGTISPDELLGKIFSKFCIGK